MSTSSNSPAQIAHDFAMDVAMMAAGIAKALCTRPEFFREVSYRDERGYTRYQPSYCYGWLDVYGFVDEQGAHHPGSGITIACDDQGTMLVVAAPGGAPLLKWSEARDLEINHCLQADGRPYHWVTHLKGVQQHYLTDKSQEFAANAQYRQMA